MKMFSKYHDVRKLVRIKRLRCVLNYIYQTGIGPPFHAGEGPNNRSLGLACNTVEVRSP